MLLAMLAPMGEHEAQLGIEPVPQSRVDGERKAIFLLDQHTGSLITIQLEMGGILTYPSEGLKVFYLVNRMIDINCPTKRYINGGRANRNFLFVNGTWTMP